MDPTAGITTFESTAHLIDTAHLQECSQESDSDREKVSREIYVPEMPVKAAGNVTDSIKDFKESIARLRPSTQRVYVAGAKTAINAAGANISQCRSYAELLTLILAAKPSTTVRLAPFLRFLQGDRRGADNSLPLEDVRGIQSWVIQTLAERIRREKNPSIASRRDMALLTALCIAPSKGSPRKWMRRCLKIDGNHVTLWDKKVEESAFALALRFWHIWRERLARPDQRRLYRKATKWSHSDLLFPGPYGEPLSRAALHNGFRRLLSGVGEGSLSRKITLTSIRNAFLAGDDLVDGEGGVSRKGPDTLAPR